MTKKDKIREIVRNILNAKETFNIFGGPEEYVSNKTNEIIKICKPRKLSAEKIIKNGTEHLHTFLFNILAEDKVDIWENE